MSVPQVQARAPVIEGPCTPSWMATWAAAEFGMILVTENGLTLAGPLLSMVAWVVSMLVTPPMPLPRMRPTLSGLLVELVPRARVFERELGRGEAHLGEAVGAGRDLAVHEVLGSKSVALGRDPHLEALGVEERYRAGPALVGQQRAPELLRPTPTGLTTPIPVMKAAGRPFSISPPSKRYYDTMRSIELRILTPHGPVARLREGEWGYVCGAAPCAITLGMSRRREH